MSRPESHVRTSNKCNVDSQLSYMPIQQKKNKDSTIKYLQEHNRIRKLSNCRTKYKISSLRLGGSG